MPVDVKCDDFEAFFPQFPLHVLEQYLATQMIDWEGGEINLRPDFGAGHLPVKTSRANYQVCYIIDRLCPCEIAGYEATGWKPLGGRVKPEKISM